MPKNLPRINDIDVKYIISFDLDLKKPMNLPKPKELKHGAKKLLETLYLNDELSDVKIFCEDKIFHSHKLILGGHSKVFKNMLFNNDMVEATSGEIKIIDTPAIAMKNLLFYIYHENVEDEMITHDLLVAADKYDIQELVNICINFMKKNLNDKNVVNIMTSAFLINQKELFRFAFKWVFTYNDAGDGHNVEIEAWKEFKEKDPVLANKMLEEAVFKSGKL